LLIVAMARTQNIAPPHLAASGTTRATRSTVAGKAPKVQLPTVGPMSNPPPPPEKKDAKTTGESPSVDPADKKEFHKTHEEEKESEEESEEESESEDEGNSEEGGEDDGSDDEAEETVVEKVSFLIFVGVVVVLLLCL
jgi:hypothetical protein